MRQNWLKYDLKRKRSRPGEGLLQSAKIRLLAGSVGGVFVLAGLLLLAPVAPLQAGPDSFRGTEGVPVQFAKQGIGTNVVISKTQSSPALAPLEENPSSEPAKPARKDNGPFSPTDSISMTQSIEPLAPLSDEEGEEEPEPGVLQFSVPMQLVAP